MKSFKEFLTESVEVEQLQEATYKPTGPGKASTSIGDLVWLKKPINGSHFAQIQGFGIKKGDVKNAHAPGAALAGSKVSSYKVKIKKSPMFANDYTGIGELSKDDFINISSPADSRHAMSWWSANSK